MWPLPREALSVALSVVIFFALSVVDMRLLVITQHNNMSVHFCEA